MQEFLKTRIKAGRITNLTDARYFAARGVSWLGFQLDAGGEGHVSPQMFSAIKGWVEGPLFVGAFGASTTEEIKTSIDLLGLDMVQVGLFNDVDSVAGLKPTPVIKEIVITDLSELDALDSQLKAYKEVVEVFLLNFDKNGIDWKTIKESKAAIQQLASCCETHKVILSIICEPDHILEMMDSLNPHGFNFVGGEEEKVGFKSFDEMDDIFDLLEIDY